MRRHLLTIYIALGIAWLAFGWWQYRSYVQQRNLIEESLNQQSHSIMIALIGGIGSHRRIGWYFEEQLQAMLDGLTQSQDVIGATIYTADKRPIMSAGTRMRVDEEETADPQEPQRASPSFRTVESFELKPLAAGPRGGGGGGGGGGRGRGFGPRYWDEHTEDAGPFSEGGQFLAELLLDRTRADLLTRQARRSHGLATAAAGIVVLCLGLVWRATVNLVEARGQAHLYATETRHLRELSQAAAGLAHETRNPLGLIRGWTQRLAQSQVSEEERHLHAQAVMEECDRVTARINQFLAFARPRDPHIASIEIEAMMRELSVILQPDLESGNLALAWDVAATSRHLQADREMLRQALFNLLQNAVQFSPPSAQVQVQVRPPHHGRTSIQVADRGPGVAEDTIESLFVPYFTTRAHGTGLGLAIVRHIATLHGWKTAYHPRDGGGAEFELSGIHVAEPEDHPDCRR
ncbi:MAG: sensor histidine kinase [Pirellulaceae bacterium]